VITQGFALVDDIRPNTWNPNKMGEFEYGKLIESIDRYGFADPLTVRQVEGGYQLVDGEHRLRAAKDAGLDRVPIINLGDISEDEAKALGIILNELKGHHDPKDLGALLDELLAHGEAEDILAGMPFTEDALRGLVSLADFDWNTLGSPAEMESSRKPSPKKGTHWVERTFRLPHEANEVLSQALDRAKDGDDVNDWQALERIAADYLAG
jgi:ParB-like chromosome segregation protein Spo0J